MGEDLLSAEPYQTLELTSTQIVVEDLLTGDYFGWDTGSKKGVFQIIEGEKLTFDYYNY